MWRFRIQADGTRAMERNTLWGRNALVVEPVTGRAETDARRDLLDDADSQPLNVLEITYKRTPEAVVADWRDRFDGLPGRLVVLSLNGSGHASDGVADPNAVVSTVNPYSLTELGMRIGRCLRLFAKADGRTLATLDSVTAMLQFVDERRAYRFLHTVTGQLRNAGADAEFRYDPNAHADRTFHVLKTTFDEVRRPVGTSADEEGAARSPAASSNPGTTAEQPSSGSVPPVAPGAVPDAR